MKSIGIALRNLTTAALCACAERGTWWISASALATFNASQVRNDGAISVALAAAAIDAYQADEYHRGERYNFKARQRRVYAERALDRLERDARAANSR